MLISILATLNFLFFFLSLTLLYLLKKNRNTQNNEAKKSDEHQNTSDHPFSRSMPREQEEIPNKILSVYQEVIAKIERIRGLQTSAVIKVESATESSILQLSNLIRRLEGTRNKATEILNMMKEKISLSIVKDTLEKKYDLNDSDTVRKKYEQMLKEVIGQLSLITEQKSQDVDKLDNIREKIKEAADEMGDMASYLSGSREQGSESAKAIEKKLRETNAFIEKSVVSLREAVYIESRFIYSTMLLLQDVVLSLVESFIQLNTIMDNTLGESSSLEDEINTIIVNLQCEDVCKEMSEYTLQILSSIVNDLHGLDIAGLVENDFIKIDEKEKLPEPEAVNLVTEEDVTFF
ncbi:hypothetical protein [Desulfonema magnum]|uniref:Uncharacterized protein n=1 Tax=Desulfonema magnum TaxID=45655 RepID=A0A975BLS6_9BACT|nr:hypothetical protein [Desulfonema magnum]QTA88054.1 Uncharacterized protein dnm_040940 [Desulfonema magnum]